MVYYAIYLQSNWLENLDIFLITLVQVYRNNYSEENSEEKK